MIDGQKDGCRRDRARVRAPRGEARVRRPGGGSSLDLMRAFDARDIGYVLARTETAAVIMAAASAEATGAFCTTCKRRRGSGGTCRRSSTRCLRPADRAAGSRTRSRACGRALSIYRAEDRVYARNTAALTFTLPSGRTSPAATPERPRRGRVDIEQQSSGAAADGNGRRSWRGMTGSAGPALLT